jgi:hypothetical protein
MTNLRAEHFCDGCGVEITWAPYYVNPAATQAGQRRSEYCCQDCAAGLRCKCQERMLLEDERRKQPDFTDMGL